MTDRLIAAWNDMVTARNAHLTAVVLYDQIQDADDVRKEMFRLAFREERRRYEAAIEAFQVAFDNEAFDVAKYRVERDQ